MKTGVFLGLFSIVAILFWQFESPKLREIYHLSNLNRISENDLTQRYESSFFGFKFLYPTSAKISIVGSEYRGLRISTGGNYEGFYCDININTYMKGQKASSEIKLGENSWNKTELLIDNKNGKQEIVEWYLEAGDLSLSITGRKKLEKYCEGIISTLELPDGETGTQRFNK